MIETLFFILVAMSVYHFILDGILREDGSEGD